MTTPNQPRGHLALRRLSHGSVLVILGLLTLQLASAGAAAGHAVLAPQVNLVRLEGHLRPPQHGDKGMTDLRLEHAGKTYRLQLTQLRVLTGSRLASRILADAAPLHPNFLLRGGDPMILRLDNGKPDDRVEITGYLRQGSRDILVTEVNIFSTR